MKKMWSIFLIITCLTFVFALSAFAEGNQVTNQGTGNGNGMDMNNFRTNACGRQ